MDKRKIIITVCLSLIFNYFLTGQHIYWFAGTLGDDVYENQNDEADRVPGNYVEIPSTFRWTEVWLGSDDVTCLGRVSWPSNVSWLNLGCARVYWQPNLNLDGWEYWPDNDEYITTCPLPRTEPCPVNELDFGVEIDLFVNSAGYTGDFLWQILPGRNITGRGLYLSPERIYEEFGIEPYNKVFSVEVSLEYDYDYEQTYDLDECYSFKFKGDILQLTINGGVNTVCWNENFTFTTTELNGPLSWDVRFGAGVWHNNVLQSTGKSITVNVNDVMDGCPACEDESSDVLWFRARTQGRPYPETEQKSVSVFPEPLPDFSPTVETKVSCNNLSDGYVNIGLQSGGTPSLMFSACPLDSEGEVDFPGCLESTKINKDSDSIFGGFTHKLYEIVLQNISTGFTGGLAGGGQRTPGDELRCATTRILDVTLTPRPQITATFTPEKCYESGDGVITINISSSGNGGSFTYYYSPNSVGSIENNLITGLKPDSYTVYVRDAKDCISNEVSDSVKKTRKISFRINTSEQGGVNISCHEGSDGEITFEGTSGGNGGYSYSIDNGATYISSPTFTELSAGTYNLRVKDDDPYNCLSETQEVTLEQPEAPLTFNDPPYEFNLRNEYEISCHGYLDGEVYFYNPTGGTTPYSFAVDGLESQPGDTTVSGFGEGRHAFKIIDVNGCIDSIMDTVHAPPPLEYTYDIIEKYHGSALSCNGMTTDNADGKYSLNVSGGVPPYSASWSGVPPVEVDRFFGDSTLTVENRRAGWDYINTEQVDIFDTNNCSIQTEIFLSEPPPMVSVLDSATTPTCYKDTTGTLTVTGANGAPPYWFSLNGEDYVTDSTDSYTFTGPAGDYTVYVYDSAYAYQHYDECQGSAGHTIPEKERVNTTFTVTHPGCNGALGSILADSITGPGNKENYVYQWFVSGTNKMANSNTTDSNLYDQPAGTYELIIYDAEGCSRPFEAEITQPKPLRFNTIMIHHASCPGSNDGVISVEGSYFGGSGGYSFSIDGGITTRPDGYFGSLGGGAYTITLTDISGCQADTTVEIKNGSIGFTIDSLSMVSCHGRDDGYLNISGTGAKGKYVYSTDNGATFTGLNEYYLYAGEYHVRVYDSISQCLSADSIVTITQPDPLGITAELVDSSACGQSLGATDCAITGGSGRYNTRWYILGSAVPLSSSENLMAGTYRVATEDMNSTGCTASDTIEVPDRPAPQITGITTESQPWCGKPLGSAQVAATSGSPAYTYQWDNDAQDTTATATGLYGDTVYTVTVTDRYGCSDVATIAPTDGPGMEITSTITDASCGQADGEIELSVTGGTGPYKYKWADSVNADTLETGYMGNLYAGEYTVEVFDQNGCLAYSTPGISNINAPEITLTRAQKSYCGLNRGEAAITVTGGTPGYLYTWKQPGDSTTLSEINEADSLYAGVYRVKITDSRNCLAFMDIEITDSLELEPSLGITENIPSACGKGLGQATAEMTGGLSPYSYQWGTAPEDTLATNSLLYSGTYWVTATDARGCAKSTSATITDRPDPQLAYLARTNSACGKALGTVTVGITEGTGPYLCTIDNGTGQESGFEWDGASGQYVATLEGLAASATPYTITARDANGCYSNTQQAMIGDAPEMELRVLDIGPVSCYGGADGRAEIEVRNGMLPYAYQWEGNSDTTAYSNNLEAYTTTVTVTDNNGCTALREIGIPSPDTVYIANITRTMPKCYGGSNGSIALVVAGGNAPYAYLWGDGQGENVATGIAAGTHQVTITDAKGCEKTAEIALEEPEKIEDTGVPKYSMLCEGQQITVDPGEEYPNCTWTSNTGFTSTGRAVVIGEDGEYYLTAVNLDGCTVTDTITLETSTSLLNAEFLMQSEAMEGDTVAIIEVSWPVPDNIEWEFPGDITRILSGSDMEHVKFHTEGTYYVGMSARLAECTDHVGKYIDIIGDPSKKGDGLIFEGAVKQFDISPNPNTGEFRAHIELREAMPVVLEIISMNGSVVMAKLEDSDLEEFDVNIYLPDPVPGQYIINLKTKNSTSTRTMVVY